MGEERFDRQMLLFGREGQRRVADTSVAIVGLGGTGSHVAQQLAFLGVRKYALVDADVVTKTSLNRLIGTTPADATDSTHKVEVAARTIRAIELEADIAEVTESFVSDLGQSALAGADVVFGCVDRDGARLLLTEYACAYDRPYIDLATDTHRDGLGVGFGGRVAVRFGAPGCPFCLDLLDPAAVQRDLTPPERREEEDGMYGVQRDALGERGPSVVSLNGIVASIAVTEFMLAVTEFARQPKRLLRYDGRRGIVVESKDEPRPGCPFCSAAGKGDAIDWGRHIRAGLGRWVR